MTADEVDDIVHEITAREIPVPTSVSPEARAVLAANRPPRRSRFEGVEDLDGWRRLIAESEERMKRIGFGRGTGAARADVEDRCIDVTVYVASPNDVPVDDRVVLEAAPHGGFMGQAPEDAEIAREVVDFIDRHCPPA